MNMKDMSTEELVSYRDDIREFMSVENKEDAEFYNKASAELLSRLKDGERAVKAMEQLVDLRKAYFNDSTIGASKYYNSCDDVFDQWRNGNE